MKISDNFEKWVYNTKLANITDIVILVTAEQVDKTTGVAMRASACKTNTSLDQSVAVIYYGQEMLGSSFLLTHTIAQM